LKPTDFKLRTGIDLALATNDHCLWIEELQDAMNRTPYEQQSNQKEDRHEDHPNDDPIANHEVEKSPSDSIPDHSKKCDGNCLPLSRQGML
jgi:hypothetical protein